MNNKGQYLFSIVMCCVFFLENAVQAGLSISQNHTNFGVCYALLSVLALICAIVGICKWRAAGKKDKNQ